MLLTFYLYLNYIENLRCLSQVLETLILNLWPHAKDEFQKIFDQSNNGLYRHHKGKFQLCGLTGYVYCEINQEDMEE